MTRNGVIVALSIVLVLALAALWATRRPAPPADARIMPIDPARVVEFVVEPPGGAASRMRRVGDEWTLVGGEGSEWRVEPARIRAALRIVSTLAGQGDAERALAPGEFGRAVAVMDDGSTVSARIGARALAGRVVASAEHGDAPGPALWVDAEIADALFTTGPSAWRSRLVAADAVLDAARLRIQAGGKALELARIQGRWAMIEPPLGSADDPAVDELLRKIAAIRIVEFDVPSGAPEEASTAILAIESRPTGEGASRRSARFEVRVGGPADAAARSLHASISRAAIDGNSSTPMWSGSASLAREELEAISLDPLEYVDRVALAAAPEDIAGIVIENTSGRREYALDLGVWKRDGERAPMEVAEGVGRVIELLTAARAARVAPAGELAVAPIATVRISRLGGDEIGSFEVSAAEVEPGKPALVIRVAGQEFSRVLAKNAGVVAAEFLTRGP